MRNFEPLFLESRSECGSEDYANQVMVLLSAVQLPERKLKNYFGYRDLCFVWIGGPIVGENKVRCSLAILGLD
jgi:hypothetical protein